MIVVVLYHPISDICVCFRTPGIVRSLRQLSVFGRRVSSEVLDSCLFSTVQSDFGWYRQISHSSVHHGSIQTSSVSDVMS